MFDLAQSLIHPSSPTRYRDVGLPTNRVWIRAILAMVLPLIFQASSLAGQEKPSLIVDDYGPWKRINSATLSPNGSWMSYRYDRLEGEDTLYVRALDGEALRVIPRGASPAFSRDSRWVAYQIAPPEAEENDRPRGRGDSEGGGEERVMVLKNLTSGDSLTFNDVASFSFPENTEVLLLRKRGPGDEADHDGGDLVVHDLSSATSLNLGNVSDFEVNERGSHLAYLVDAVDDAGNGLYLLELSSNRIRALDTHQATYARLSWNGEGSSLAALRGNTPEEKTRRDNVLLVLRNLNDPGAIETFVPSEAAGFPEGYVLSELNGLTWSEDSNRIFLGIKEQADDREEREDRANVDVWHWADVQPQSVQEVRARRNRNRTWTSVINLSGGAMSFVRLADEALESVSPAGNSRWGIGRDPTPYEYEITWGGSRGDYYRVDLDTGERSLMAEGIGRSMGASDDGAYWLFLRDEEVIARELANGNEINLTQTTGIDFINRQDDHPYELPTYGTAGWSRDGGSVVLNHRYDIWEVPLDGGEAVNLTAGVGAEEKIRFRIAPLGDERFGRFSGGGGDEGIDVSEPLLLSAYGDRTKKSGYWQVEKGDEPEPLIWLDESVGRPSKADDADRIIFTRQTFVESPNYWVSNTSFRNPRKVTDANPQQADFAWSPGRVLIDYVDERGNELQATLALPAGYEEGKRYPMLVYFYETMSQRHHQYSMPTYDDRPHLSTYASNGYLILQPDIVYTEGKPGSSALDDLTAAVNKVIELGYADPEAIGLQGHSWSGYQSSFVVTQTDLFSAVVTGAPPTNLISFYNTLYRSSGTIQQGITEVGQVRMGTTPFEDFDLFVSQSPVHHAEKITTPFMILHGTADGAVDWMQGLEYYGMARRLGKEVIFLSYPDEGHHLSRKNNQIDFQIRMMQFFDHHLKGTQPAKWMVEGVEFLEKEYANPRVMMDGSLWGKVEKEEEGT